MDSAAPLALTPAGLERPELRFRELCGVAIDEFWREADAGSAGLAKDEWAGALLEVGAKHHYGVAADAAPTRAAAGAFWRSLQLRDLALARGCALGRELAWRQFLDRFRAPLTQAAIGITGSGSRGQELADSLYAELLGVTERGEKRRSPLEYYSGRGSLMGFLRATLAQRNVDYHRRAGREVPIGDEDVAEAARPAVSTEEALGPLRNALAKVLGAVAAEERFLLTAWFLDRRTMLEIARVLRVHEATVSRRIQRLTERLHQELLKKLQAEGMSRAAAEEALETDPRDVDLNLRGLLQAARPGAFQEQKAEAEPS